MTNNANEATTPKKKGGIEKLMIVIGILGFAALVIYQVFFCATCYGISERVLPAAQKTEAK